MLPRIPFFLLVFSVLLLAECSWADESEGERQFPEEGRFYFYLGDFDAEITGNELENPRSEFAFGLGLLFEQADYLDWGFDVIVINRRYDTPPTVTGGPFTIVSDDMSLSTLGLTVSARVKYAEANLVSVYAGAEAGLYFSKLTLSASTLGFPGTHEEQSNDPGMSYLYGVMLNLDNDNFVGVECRRLFLESSLSPVTTGAVDVGGRLVLLTYAFRF